jgi:hypothetical protein
MDETRIARATPAMHRKADRLVDEATGDDQERRWLRGWAERPLGHLTVRREFWIIPGSVEVQRAAQRKNLPPVAHWTAIDGSGCTCVGARGRLGICTHMLAAHKIERRRLARRERDAELARRAGISLAELDAAAAIVASTGFVAADDVDAVVEHMVRNAESTN